MSKFLKIFLIILSVFIIFKVLGLILSVTVKNKVISGLREVIYSTVVDDSKEAKKSLYESYFKEIPDINSFVMSIDSWSRYSYPEEGFSITFPNTPSLNNSKETSKFPFNFYSYVSEVLVPGESIKYTVVVSIDNQKKLGTQRTYVFFKELLMDIFDNSIQITSETNSHPQYYTMTYIIREPKMFFGKLIVAGNNTYNITTECLYCTEVPYTESFFESFKIIR